MAARFQYQQKKKQTKKQVLKTQGYDRKRKFTIFRTIQTLLSFYHYRFSKD